jgi:two-component sensor histidine kinase
VTVTADFVSDRSELTKLEGFTADFAQGAGLSDKDLFALQIIVEELVTNVIDYGGVPAGEHAVRVDLSAEDGELLIRITDRGAEYNPLLREEIMDAVNLIVAKHQAKVTVERRSFGCGAAISVAMFHRGLGPDLMYACGLAART